MTVVFDSVTIVTDSHNTVSEHLDRGFHCTPTLSSPISKVLANVNIIGIVSESYFLLFLVEINVDIENIATFRYETIDQVQCRLRDGLLESDHTRVEVVGVGL
jgi:hypothetical protein